MAVDPDPRFLHAIEKGGLGVHNRIHIVMKELGMVAYKFMMTERFPEDKRAHMTDLKTDLGDLMVQVDMLALDLGLVPEEVKALGCRHTRERYKDFERNMWAPSETYSDTRQAPPPSKEGSKVADPCWRWCYFWKEADGDVDANCSGGWC